MQGQLKGSRGIIVVMQEGRGTFEARDGHTYTLELAGGHVLIYTSQREYVDVPWTTFAKTHNIVSLIGFEEAERLEWTSRSPTA